MTREEIQQYVYDTLGKILVDKSEIHEDSTFQDLALDDEDVNDLFSTLENHFSFKFPAPIRKRAADAPEHLTLNFLVDFVLTMSDD